MQNRLALSVPSDYDFALIETWAKSTNRATGNLGAYLLERGLIEARKEGLVPAQVIASVNAKFFSEL